MKKTYVEPICQMNFISDAELLTVEGSGEYFSWNDVEGEVVDA